MVSIRTRSRFKSWVMCSAVVLGGVFSSGAALAGSTAVTPQPLPYMTSIVAGGAASTPAAGASCGSGSYVSTDAYGSGCLATQVVLTNPRHVVKDSAGNIYFTQVGGATSGFSATALVWKIDASTGIITRIAGGASSNPANGAACGSYTSTDAYGDGCLATSVELNTPSGIALDKNGNIYITEYYGARVRKIAKDTGIITSVVGANGYGYNVNSSAGTVTAANGKLYYPMAIAFDAQGNLYIADEGNNAIEVVNMQSSSITIAGVTIPADTIATVAGTTCTIGTGSGTGCKYGNATDGAQALSTYLDAPYDVGVDTAGNIYISNEYTYQVLKVDPSGVLRVVMNTSAKSPGSQTPAVTDYTTYRLTRGPATGIALDRNYGMTLDSYGNYYVGSSGSTSAKTIIWRVDAPTQGAFAIAGATATGQICSGGSATGNGCPGMQALFSGYNGSIPGIGGMYADVTGNLLIAESNGNILRQLSSGLTFGQILPTQPTNMVNIHFGVGDTGASYIFTSGSNNFTVGAANCTANSDSTTDCLLPITATPTVGGPFSGTLHVTSVLGATADLLFRGSLLL